MLRLLRARCEAKSSNAGLRLKTHHADALVYLDCATTKKYDLVVTHFFLDCLTQDEVESLVAAISTRLAPRAVWLVSDFRIPPGAMRLPGELLVRSLYLAFRILTGLHTAQLPDHARAFAPFFTRTSHSQSLFGLLTTEIWTFDLREDV